MELNLKSLSNKNYKFKWKDPMHSTLVEVKLPDLTQLEYSLWGDWGPMYTFRLLENEKLLLKYNGETAKVTQDKLNVDSPAYATDRDQYPFYFSIEDQAKKLKFNLYINKNYDLGKVEVIRTKDKVKLFECDEAFQLQEVI